MPGLRRLLDPRPDAEGDARLRLPQGEHRLHQRHRLLRAPALLHEHVRLPHHPRPRADARHRPQGGPAGPHGLGHHRRRRRPVDRRQPRHPRHAAQRGRQAGHVQQPHLRPDQGPGVADLRARQAHQVDARRDHRPAGHAALAGAGRGGDLRRALRGHPHGAHPGDARREPATTTARPSSRSSRTATSSTTAPTGTSPTARSARTGCSSWSTASR